MKWFRFYHEFVDDPKIAMMSDSDQLLWVKALCLASDSNQRGCILLTDEEICWKLRITLESWRHAIDKFRAKGMIEHCEGGYRICNWDKRQFSSDSSAERVAKHREKKAKNPPKKTPKQTAKTLVSQDVTACNVTVTPPDTDPDPDPDTEQNRSELPLSGECEGGGANFSNSESEPTGQGTAYSQPAKPPRPVSDPTAAAYWPKPWRTDGQLSPAFCEYVGNLFPGDSNKHPRTKGRNHIINLERSGDPSNFEKLNGYWDDYNQPEESAADADDDNPLRFMFAMARNVGRA